MLLQNFSVNVQAHGVTTHDWSLSVRLSVCLSGFPLFVEPGQSYVSQLTYRHFKKDVCSNILKYIVFPTFITVATLLPIYFEPETQLMAQSIIPRENTVLSWTTLHDILYFKTFKNKSIGKFCIRSPNEHNNAIPHLKCPYHPRVYLS